MHPILIQLGPVTLYSFGLLVALGFISATLWIAQRAKASGEDMDTFLQAVFWIVISGFLGARLMYVVYFPDQYLSDPLRILTDRGGLVWYGGLLASTIASIIFVRIKHISILKFGDIVMLPAALGLAIGRVGCFLTGCCYGSHSNLPWAVHFPTGHETYPHAVHPTQLYESMALLVFIGLMLFVSKRVKMPGFMLAYSVIGFGVIRFLIEYLRGDVIYWIPNLFTASQVFSLVGITLGIILVLRLRQNARTSKAPVALS